MARARTTFRTIGLLGVATIVATGCGGGDVPADTGATPPTTPTPGATTPGATVTDPAAPAEPGAIDPATGQPIVAETPAATSIPTLEGDDIGGGLSAVGGSPLFEAGAVSLDELQSDTTEEDSSDFGSSTGTTATDPGPADPAPAPAFGGAKIYVDGIVHDVTKGGTFPKGNPVFRLLSISSGDIEIELVAGEFSTNGGSGSILDKGELVSMLNTSESLTYRIKYLRPITDTDGVSF